MISFAGVRPGQLGCVKSVSVRDGFAPEKSRQSVEQAGLVLASLDVPVTRQIEVDLLARADDRDGLFLTLHKVARWLATSGEGKLVLRKNRDVYYRARCTGVTVPEFGGASARLTATFTCQDYRPYATRNDKPVGEDAPPGDNFTFAGKHCLRDMGLLFVLNQRTGVPQPSPNKYDVPGRYGTLRYDGEFLPLAEGSAKGTLYLVGPEPGKTMTAAQARDALHAAASWLVGAGRAELIFDADPTRAALAEICAEAACSAQDWQNGKLDVTLTTQPLLMDAQPGSVTQALALAANAAQTVDLAGVFPRGIGFTTPLVIEITNAGAAAIGQLTLGYRDRLGKARECVFSGGGFSLGTGQTLTLDGEAMTARIGSANAISGMASGDFPSASPGATALSVKAGTAASVSVTVTARARWV